MYLKCYNFIMNNNDNYEEIINDLTNNVYNFEEKISEIYSETRYPFQYGSNTEDDLNRFLNDDFHYENMLNNYNETWTLLNNNIKNLSNFYDAGYKIDFNPKKKFESIKGEYEFYLEEFIETLFENISCESFKRNVCNSVYNRLVEIYNYFLNMDIDKHLLFLYKHQLNEFCDMYGLDLSLDSLIKNENNLTIKNIDDMDGIEFENFCFNLLKDNGYSKLLLTKTSGDQGVDIVCYKDDVKFAFQCKCYSQDIGNSAIQEVVSGRAFYDCDVAIVITNRYFTNNAIELAKINKVKLWDRDKLISMLNSLSKC